MGRVLAGTPPRLQAKALERLRQAPEELRTERAVRDFVRAHLVPFERALFDPELYEEVHSGPVWVTETGERDPGAHGRYFADPELFLRLQREALGEVRAGLGERFSWVEVVEASRLPEGLEEDPEGAGAVVLVRNGLYDVRVVEGVRRDGGRAEAGREVRERVEPFGGEERVPALIEAPSEARVARAARLRTRALQEAVATDPVAALRAAVASLLARGPAAGMRVERLEGEQAVDAPPSVVRGLEALGQAVGIGGAGELFDREAPGRPTEGEIYVRLLAVPRGVLVRMFAAVVASTLQAGSATGEELTVESPGLACELARDLELAVTDWRPTAKYFREFGLEELRVVAGRLGVELPESAGREEAIEALLESERIGEYSPPELFFRPGEVPR